MSRPYLIEGHDYQRNAAGVRVLHYLCHMLREADRDAFMTSYVLNPHWNTRTADEEMQREIARDGIVVYPEVEDGNPLQARHVVRYLLNIPGRIREATFTERELTYYYCGLLEQYAPQNSRQLFIPIVDTRVFLTYSLPIREQKMVYRLLRRDEKIALKWFGKGKETPELPETKNAVEITLDWPDNPRLLANLFQMMGWFYSYQPYGAMVIESRLCGCPTVVIPNRYWDREAFARGTPGGMDGLAWGTAPEEILRAEQTLFAFPDAYHRYCAGAFFPQFWAFLRETEAWANSES